MSDQLPVPAASNTFERIKRVNRRAQSSGRPAIWRGCWNTRFPQFPAGHREGQGSLLNSGHAVADHFAEITDMVGIGSGAQRAVEDWALSRYACYLVIQNADPSKPLVALGQTYFAVQTRRQELADDEALKEDKKRLLLRAEMKKHNKNLAGVAKQAGVIQPVDYAIFMDHGYRGLYGGLSMRDIHERKRLKPKEHVLDHMGSTELAANLFRATQTEEKLRRENVRNKDARQPNSQRSGPQSAPDHPRIGRHDAGKSAGGREHQEGREPREKAAQGRAEENRWRTIRIVTA